MPIEIRESVYRITGAHKYQEDLPVGDALHVGFVRLPVARARIRSIDGERARALAGVVDLVTPADIDGPVPRYGALAMDQPILAVGETRFWGEPVAVVLAESTKIAREAARLVTVDYEELKPVLTAEDALADGAPLVMDPAVRPDSPHRDSNIMMEFPLAWGDVDAAEREAALVIENTFRAPMMHHFAMETFGCTARPDGEGVAIVTAIQHPFQLQRVTAAALGLPLSQVRVQAVEAGGGFGGRGYPKMEVCAAYLARRFSRAVHMKLSGEEGFSLATREAARIHIRSGFASDGRILFQDVHSDLMVGAYSDISPRVVGKAGIMAAGPYRVPNARILARGIFTNQPPSTAFRGFGATHAGFAFEGQLDEAAERLGIDRVEIRLRNVPERGEEFIPDDLPADGHWGQAIQRCADLLGWNSPLPDGRGRGIAVGSKNSIPASTSHARVRMVADGTVTAYVGTTEIGQGTRTTLARIVARELGLPLERVTLVQGDTAEVPFDMGTAGSRSTVTMGRALQDACAKLRDRLAQIAARQTGADPPTVTFEGATVVAGGRRITFRDLLAAEFNLGSADISCDGTFRGEANPNHPLGGPTPFYEYLVTGVEVSVDRETGEVTLHRLVNVTDIGTAINPRRAAGIDDGAATMGIGASMMEHIVFDERGRILNPSSLDYRIPTISDVPTRMESAFIENGDGPGPYGSKGMGEGAIMAMAPSIASAIHACTGVRMRQIPFSPEAVWRALRAQQGSN